MWPPIRALLLGKPPLQLAAPNHTANTQHPPTQYQRAQGTASITIHLKSCSASFLAEEAKKPVHLRRPLPAAPDKFDAIATMPVCVA